MVNLSKLSEALKELMAERGLNQSELAKAIGTCSSKLSSYITEQRAPNYQILSLYDGAKGKSGDFHI